MSAPAIIATVFAAVGLGVPLTPPSNAGQSIGTVEGAPVLAGHQAPGRPAMYSPAAESPPPPVQGGVATAPADPLPATPINRQVKQLIREVGADHATVAAQDDPGPEPTKEVMPSAQGASGFVAAPGRAVNGAAPPAPGREVVKGLIRQEFGPAGDAAVAVASCETGGTFRADARNGQFRGIFQMGERERARFGHGSDALTQIRAAYSYWRVAGWQPWAACR